MELTQKISLRIILLLAFLSFGNAGCVKPTPPVQTLNEANKKFLKTIREEYKLNPLIRVVGHTLWIYLPVEEPILDYKSTPDGPRRSSTPTDSLNIRYLDGRPDKTLFDIEYDIRKEAKYLDDKGLNPTYTESFRKKQNDIATTLYRSYTDLGEKYGKKTAEAPPDFIVLVVANVKTGVVVRNYMAFQDFKYSALGAFPLEELAQRSISEFTGEEKMIGDKLGQHVDYHDVTWMEFLTKQILNRIRFKYQQSDFKPADDPEIEILKTVNDTVKGYQPENFQNAAPKHFQVPAAPQSAPPQEVINNFAGVRLHNLATGKEYLFDKEQIQRMVE